MTDEALAGLQAAAGDEPSAPDPHSWRDDVWTMLVGALDGILRSCYGVAPFSDDARCIFRIGQSRVREAVRLRDGTVLDPGETIGALHFWNEHLPAFSSAGPDLGWAVVMRRRVAWSLRELAVFIETEPGWGGIRAFRAEAALSSRIGDPQLRRVALRYGFECVNEAPSMLRHVHDFGECFSAWGLARAYNPGALARQRFFRPYRDLWIGRAALLRLHGAGGAAAGAGGVARWSCS